MTVLAVIETEEPSGKRRAAKVTTPALRFVEWATTMSEPSLWCARTHDDHSVARGTWKVLATLSSPHGVSCLWTCSGGRNRGLVAVMVTWPKGVVGRYAVPAGGKNETSPPGAQ